MFQVTSSGGENTTVSSFSLNSATGTRVFLADKRLRGFFMVNVVAGDRAQVNYSDVVAGTYMPIFAGEWSGNFIGGSQETIGWFKSQDPTSTLYVLFIY